MKSRTRHMIGHATIPGTTEMWNPLARRFEDQARFDQTIFEDGEAAYFIPIERLTAEFERAMVASGVTSPSQLTISTEIIFTATAGVDDKYIMFNDRNIAIHVDVLPQEPGRAEFSELATREAPDYAAAEARVEQWLDSGSALITDVHTIQAMKMYGVTKENVTPEMRRTAKSHNYWDIYAGGGVEPSDRVETGRPRSWVPPSPDGFTVVESDYHDAPITNQLYITSVPKRPRNWWPHAAVFFFGNGLAAGFYGNDIAAAFLIAAGFICVWCLDRRLKKLIGKKD